MRVILHYARGRGSRAEELVRLHFVPAPGGEERVSVRGKDVGAFGRATGSFQWTHAVRGLSELLHRYSRWSGCGSPPCIEGGLGSSAAALDFALGKPPLWLRDMFGVTPAGEPFARRLFLRSNPECAGPGPVSISVNPRLLQPGDVRVESLAPRACSPAVPLGTPASDGSTQEHAHAPASEWLNHFQRGFNQEVSEALSAASAYLHSPSAWQKARFAADPLLQSMLPRGARLWHQQEESLYPSERLGARFFAEEGKRPLQELSLRVVVPVALGSCTTIFRYLQYQGGLPITVDTCYPHGVEILKRMLTSDFVSPPDLIVIGVAVAARYLARAADPDYQPLMIMPGNSHRVVAPRRALETRRKLDGVFSFVNDEPSTATLYFDHLRLSERVRAGSTSCNHAEPHESFEHLGSGDPDARAVLFFPYRAVNEFFNDCVTIDNPRTEDSFRESVLFVHRRHSPATVRTLSLAVRHAWRSIQESPRARHQAVEEVCNEKSFQAVIGRFAGVALER